MIRLLAIMTCLWPFTVSQVHAEDIKFAGAWSAKLCPQDRTLECGRFSLYFTQHGDVICGSHSAATPGSGRVDEGLAKSVTGKVVGPTAFVFITSGRDGSVFKAKAERAGRLLKWELLDLVSGDGNDSVLAEEAVLRRVEAGDNLNRVGKECD